MSGRKAGRQAARRAGAGHSSGRSRPRRTVRGSRIRHEPETPKGTGEWYRSLFENVPVGVYRTTPDGRILMASPVLVRMLGYGSFEELAERNLEKEGYEPGYTRSRFKELLERDGTVLGIESAWKRRDGTVIFVRENARAVIGPRGGILYYEGTAEDISDRHEAEAEAARAREYLRTVLNSVNDIIVVMDMERRIVSCNDAVEKVAGYRKEEIMGMSIADFYATPDTAERMLKVILKEIQEHGYSEGETLLKRKDGTTFPASFSASLLMGPDGKPAGVVAVAHDITRRKQDEAARAEHAKEKARGELFGFIISALPVFASGVPAQVRDTMVRAFADRFEENMRPRFRARVEQGDPLDEVVGLTAGYRAKALHLYLSWFRDMVSGIGTRAATSVAENGGHIEFRNCPWLKDARGNPVFCLVCRAMVLRSFTWTGLGGCAEQMTSIAGGAERCRFDIHPADGQPSGR